jgi:fluorothreonine transaldolase
MSIAESPGRLAGSVLPLSSLEALIAAEESDNSEVLHLTANETLLSPLTLRTLSTSLNNRYLLEHLEMRENSPSRLNNFLYRGLDQVNRLEESATEISRGLFGAEHVEFRCLSGIHAMQTTIAALSKPGDKIMRISTKDGGHFLTELICRSFGRQSCTYVYEDISRIDLERTRAVFEAERPTLLFLDAMNYLFPFPIKELKEICGPDVPLVYDASHTLGLIAGGQWQDPLGEGADILQANTHKTFFGPQKGIILGRSRGLMERISYTLSNGMVSSQHTGSTLALFVALHEMNEYGREYAAKVVESSHYLARSLHERGIPIVAADQGFTRNHMFFVDTRTLGTGPALLQQLLRANIAANRLVAFEHIDTLRMGVQELVRRGFTLSEFDLIADWVAGILHGETQPAALRPQVLELLAEHRSILYCAPVEESAPYPPEPGSRTATVTTPEVDAATPAPAPALEPAPVSPAAPPRWIDIRLRREPIPVEPEKLVGARNLGSIAGVFEHQTDSAGNVSCQVDGVTYVTASGAYIRDLADQDFVELEDCTDWTLSCRGAGAPSAESYMHWLVRTSVPAAFLVHNHYIPRERELAGLDVLVIPPKEYGSVQLAEAVTEAAPKSQIIYVRRHGLVVWSEDLASGQELLSDLVAAVGNRISSRPSPGRP